MFSSDADALALSVHYVLGCAVPGDIVEFGCYLGRTAGILARALSESERGYIASDNVHGIGLRNLWVFDSFEGFPETSTTVDAASPHIQSRVWRAGIPAGGTPEGVREVCSHFLPNDRIKIIKGWYKDTLSQIPDGTKFSLIHVDCDYYESTSQVLTHLFGRDMIADGCTILFDDWYCNRGSPDFGEQKAWSEAVEKFKPRVADWGAYGIASRRFIVNWAKQ